MKEADPGHGSLALDPRVRVRGALRDMTRAGVRWDPASATVFRNLLLDRTGSDARPLAELLVEAAGRGWLARLGVANGPLSSGSWDALVSPFLMQWSVERFVQPEMARWAVESWGYALGFIGPELLRVAPPASVARHVSSSHGPVASAGAPTAPPSRRTAAVRAPASAPGRPGHVPTVPSVAPSRRTSAVAPPRGAGRLAGTRAGRGVSVLGARQVRWVTGGLLAMLGVMTLAVLVRVSGAANGSPTTAADTGVAMAPERAEGAMRGGVREVRTMGGALAPPRADSARMLFVEPPRRASGEGRRMVAGTPAGMPAARGTGARIVAVLDEARLVDGTRMRGRVELVRSGTVIFHDAATGLRHELRKEEIDEIVTEFGTSVRFRGADAGRGATASAVRDARDVRDVRGGGLSGRYVVRYGAADVTGARDCTDVWGRAPGSEDSALVRHVPGADTLTVVFVGGDQFPSNVDERGNFASTLRIMPGGARTSTGLTTRLSGRIRDGGLDLLVNLVFFRRMRAGGDVTCNVAVRGDGRRVR